jgi:protein required for attachment to host cells
MRLKIVVVTILFYRRFPLKHAEKIIKKSHKAGLTAEKPASRTWIVVANGHTAKIYKKHDAGIEAVGKILNKKTHQNHKSSSHKSLDHLHDPAYLKELVKWLDEATAGDHFDEFILVAAPETREHFRNAFSKSMLTRMASEVDKDIADLEDHEIHKELCDTCWH